jgi:hypothetical protein
MRADPHGRRLTVKPTKGASFALFGCDLPPLSLVCCIVLVLSKFVEANAVVAEAASGRCG